MLKKSVLKEFNCLVAMLKPFILSHKENVEKDAQNIEGLFRYVVELYNGIARNKNNSFCGKFDFDVILSPSQFLIYKKLKNSEISEQEYEEFLTAISIFQMVFIDENIYLSGFIDKTSLFISKDGIMWGNNLCINPSVAIIEVSNSLAYNFNNKFTKNIENKIILDFLPTVYRFNPFKDEEGNMLRHIVNPINKVKKDNKELLSKLIEYCKDYIKEKNFSLKL